jgi:hypothetical protein
VRKLSVWHQPPNAYAVVRVVVDDVCDSQFWMRTRRHRREQAQQCDHSGPPSVNE